MKAVRLLRCAPFCLALAVIATYAWADDQWMNWRGSKFDGTAVDGVYPVTWSEDSNVQWKVPVPGRGGSTPIVVGEHIFLTTGREGFNHLQAYDFSGKQVWDVELGAERAGKHKKGSGSNSSPVSDGKFLYAYFKSGDLVCTDLNGKIVWQRNLQQEFGEDTLWWDLGTSPIVTKDAVIVAVMQSGPSYIVAFEKSSGHQLWKVDRLLNANEESNQAYTTPTIAQTEQGEVLLTLGADHVTAHALGDGKELWRVGGFNPTNQKNYRCISSPLVAGDLVVCPYARGLLVTAVRYQNGIIDSKRVAWQREAIGADVPTPTIDGHRLFFITDKGEVTCVAKESGETIWSGSLPKNRNNYSSSPILAGGHLYALREDGLCFVLGTGDHFQIVAENQVEAMTVSTPVFVRGKILLRSFDSLYCIASVVPSQSANP
jgi:outer membrane protein assembly factor BamB